MVSKNPGDSVTVEITIENVGNVSLDVGVGSDVIGLISFADQTATGLAVGATQTFTFTGTVPSSASPGDYDVYAIVADPTFSTTYDEQTLTNEVTIGSVSGAVITNITVS